LQTLPENVIGLGHDRNINGACSIARGQLAALKPKLKMMTNGLLKEIN